MPTVRIDDGKLKGWLTFGGDYKPGDMPPTGYLDWHEWAEVQHKAGLRQVRCGRCIKCRYPQELSGIDDVSYPFDSKGNHHEIKSPVCKECEKKNPVPHIGKKAELPKPKQRKRKK